MSEQRIERLPHENPDLAAKFDRLSIDGSIVGDIAKDRWSLDEDDPPAGFHLINVAGRYTVLAETTDDIAPVVRAKLEELRLHCPAELDR